MHSIYYELSIVINYSRRLAWAKDTKEIQDNLIDMFICGVP